MGHLAGNWHILQFVSEKIVIAPPVWWGRAKAQRLTLRSIQIGKEIEKL